MGWPQSYDGRGWSNAVVKAYSVQSIPWTYLIDRQGRIAKRGLRGAGMEAAARELMAEPRVPADEDGGNEATR